MAKSKNIASTTTKTTTTTSKSDAEAKARAEAEAEAKAQAEAEARAKAEKISELNSEISSLRAKRNKLVQEYKIKESELSSAKEIYTKNVGLLESISNKKRNMSYVTVSNVIYEQISGSNYTSLINSYNNVMDSIQDEIDSIDRQISSKESELNSL